jgi:aromatase
MRWVQDFSMKPEAPATDDVVEANMNKNTKIQMALIKEKLEAQTAEGGS